MTSPCSLPADIEFLRAASWPGAAAPESLINPRPQPPRAPKRGPSAASWVVPPLMLPMAPLKLSGHASVGSSTNDGSGQDTARSSDKDMESDGEEAGEVCVFSLGDAICEDDEEDLEPGPTTKFELITLDDWELEPVVRACPEAKGIRCDGPGGVPTLGASPVLLSVIERMAVGRQLGRQTTV
mmetsp:Transcript_25220/g.71862  ORF Transcript_25220/g.71862 Transcript_25220/m.71862 type:complete len:183 (-) Transcript_25220:167-715(-)